MLYCILLALQQLRSLRFIRFQLKVKRANEITVVILLKATKHAEREQINKSHWLNNVSRAHFIGRERFPKHQFLVF